MRNIYSSLFIIPIGLLFISINVSAQWNADPALNTPVCTTPAISQYFPQLVPDGNGGVFITWIESPDGNSSQVFAQHMSAGGNKLWAAAGVPVTAAVGLYSQAQIVNDGNSGVIISWADVAGGTIHHFMQRINAAGQRLWTTNGVAVCPTQTVGSYFYQLLADRQGGAIIVWDDQRGGNNAVYAQKFNAAGALQWPVAGLNIAPALTNPASYEAVADSTGGLIFCYTLTTGLVARNDVFVQRINAQGFAQWGGGGINICAAPKDQLFCKMVRDTGDNVIVVWQDFRLDPARSQIYGQRITGGGSLLWPADGVLLVDSVVAASTLCKITADTKNGVQVFWLDKFTPVNSNTAHLYNVRIDSMANPVSSKTEIATWQDFQIPTDFKAVPDYKGGSFISWNQPSALSGNPYEIYDVYAQHLLPNNTAEFPLTGQVVSAALHSQLYQQLVGDSSGAAFIAWSDLRNGVDFDLYAGKLSAQAALPVHWISFEGRGVQQTVLLEWKTSNEINNQGFFIQRSADGIHFNDIGFTPASNKAAQTTYHFTDANPLPAANFYRLNQVDKDGRNEYSKTVRVNITPPTSIRVFPNPATTQIYLQGDIAGAVVSIYSTDGRKVKEVRNGSRTTLMIGVGELGIGEYFVNVVNAGNKKIKTFGLIKIVK